MDPSTQHGPNPLNGMICGSQWIPALNTGRTRSGTEPFAVANGILFVEWWLHWLPQMVLCGEWLLLELLIANVCAFSQWVPALNTGRTRSTEPFAAAEGFFSLSGGIHWLPQMVLCGEWLLLRP